jgi:STE24 endopeptidase
MDESARELNHFTGQALAAISAAQREAQRLGSSSIDPEHLLLGLVWDARSDAVRALQALGAGPERVREAVQKMMQPGAQAGGELHLSQQAKQAIEFAVAEAKELHQQAVGAEHLLLGILHEENGQARDALSALGISLTAARMEVARIYQQPAVQLDPVRQQQAVALARDVQRARRVLQLVVIVLVALMVFLVFEFSPLFSLINTLSTALAQMPVLNWQPVAGWSPLLILFYFVMTVTLLLAIVLPFSWYLSFVLPRRYNMRKRNIRDWVGLVARGLAVFFGQIWVIVELMFLFAALQPQTWWIWTALVQFFITVLAARLIGSLRFLPYLNELEPLRSEEVRARFQMLSQRLQLPPIRILQMNVSHRTASVNAFFAGWGGGRRVILTDTMIENFTPDEIEVILAHELAHFVRHDIWTRLVMGGLTFLGLFYLFYTYLGSLSVGEDFTLMSVIRTVLPIVVFILLLSFLLLSVRYRRYQEYQADEFALQTTGKVQAFKDAMTRLTNINMVVATSTRRAKHPGSHPTLLKRLQHADEFAARQGL